MQLIEKIAPFYILFALPLTILDIPWEPLIIADALNRTYQFWTHTRLIPKLPSWFEFVFVTPSHHRVHHGVNPEYIDKNYSGFLILWDRLFGTFEEESAEPVYGITKKLNTYNPVLANFHVYRDIFAKIFSRIKFSEKLGYTFGYPGWDPSQKERIFSQVNPRANQDYPIYLKSKILILLFFIILVISSLIFIRLSIGLTLSLKAILILGFIFLFWILGKVVDSYAL